MLHVIKKNKHNVVKMDSTLTTAQNNKSNKVVIYLYAQMSVEVLDKTDKIILLGSKFITSQVDTIN